MTDPRRARPTRLLPRLSAALLALAILLPGRPLQAAAPAHARSLPHPSAPAGPAINHRPVATDDTLVAFANVEFQELYVLDNDYDIDPGDRVTVKEVGFSQHGSTANDFYSIPYGSVNGYVGTDHFQYVITDLGGLTATATVTVTVVPYSGTASGRFAVYSGPYDSARWTISPFGGTNGSNAANGVCDGSAGLSVEDALLYTNVDHFNAFDNGMTLWINGAQLPASPVMDVTHHSLISGPTNAAGLRVYVKYYGLPNSDTLRTLVSFINVSSTAIPVTATVASNLGTDAFTVIPGTSSGDSVFDTSDRWVVTSDDLSNPGEIVDTHVLFGPGSPPVTPNLAATTVFGCGDLAAQTSPTDTHGIRSRFVFSVPGNSTKNLLFFNQAHDSNAGALADAAAWFNASPVGLLEGLTSTELADVVNWKLSAITRSFLPLLDR